MGNIAKCTSARKMFLQGNSITALGGLTSLKTVTWVGNLFLDKSIFGYLFCGIRSGCECSPLVICRMLNLKENPMKNFGGLNKMKEINVVCWGNSWPFWNGTFWWNSIVIYDDHSSIWVIVVSKKSPLRLVGIWLLPHYTFFFFFFFFLLVAQ